MTDGLTTWLDQQLENQRFRGEALKTMAYALPDEAARFLTETGGFLITDADAKRRILNEHSPDRHGYCDVCDDNTSPFPCSTVRLVARPYSGSPGYRTEWGRSDT